MNRIPRKTTKRHSQIGYQIALVSPSLTPLFIFCRSVLSFTSDTREYWVNPHLMFNTQSLKQYNNGSVCSNNGEVWPKSVL